MKKSLERHFLEENSTKEDAEFVAKLAIKEKTVSKNQGTRGNNSVSMTVVLMVNITTAANPAISNDFARTSKVARIDLLTWRKGRAKRRTTMKSACLRDKQKTLMMTGRKMTMAVPQILSLTFQRRTKNAMTTFPRKSAKTTVIIRYNLGLRRKEICIYQTPTSCRR